MQKMRWNLTQVPNDEKIAHLAEKLSANEAFPLPLANILFQRNIRDFNSAKDFFSPENEVSHDPFLMKDMDLAVNRLISAIEKNEKIMIYGDYDVDGTTSVSIMLHFFKDIGVECSYYIPDRYTEGYGISYQGIDYAIKEKVTLLIVLDCGTKAVEKIGHAAGNGLDVIICDHHTPGTQLPPAIAMLNPKQEDCNYPFKELSACGVGFKYLQALVERLKSHPDFSEKLKDYELLEKYADLLALSICCDIVPMRGENRMLTRFGIKKIQSNPMKGIEALKALSDNERDWIVSDLVFFLGPRINAAGRLGSAKSAVNVLMGDSAEIKQLALGLHHSNSERRALDEATTKEALWEIQNNSAELDRNSTVLYKEDWHKGIIGIVASRLIEKHYRPTVLLTKSQGHWVGSGRSVQGFDLYSALEACSEHIVQFGGHMYAAGLTVKDDEIEAFKEKFEEIVSERITEAQKVPILDIAYTIDFSYINARFIRLIRRFSPFGPHNLEPVFEAKNVNVTGFRILKEAHLRLDLKQNGISFEAIGFGLAEKWNLLNPSVIDIAFQPNFKTWNGKTYIQLNLKDFKAAR